MASHRWNPALHPRDREGKFTTSVGIGGGSSPATSRMADNAIRRAAGRPVTAPTRGMPDTIASTTISTQRSGSLTLDRHVSGGYTLTTPDGRTTTLTDTQARDLTDTISLADDWPRGETETLPGIGRITKHAADHYQVDLDSGARLDLTRRDNKRLELATERMAASARVDTGYGDIDVYSTGKNLGIRHLGDDGRPVEIELDRRSYLKIDAAINRIIDDIDFDGFEQATTTRTVSTTLGPVRVELTGPYDEPGSRIRIGPATGDAWGLVFDATTGNPWSTAVGEVADAMNWR